MSRPARADIAECVRQGIVISDCGCLQRVDANMRSGMHQRQDHWAAGQDSLCERSGGARRRITVQQCEGLRGDWRCRSLSTVDRHCRRIKDLQHRFGIQSLNLHIDRPSILLRADRHNRFTVLLPNDCLRNSVHLLAEQS